jgi:hypothetical protein
MASISTLYASGGSGSLDATETRNARRVMSGAAPPADGAPTATLPRRVSAGSGTVLLYARHLPSPDAAERSAKASSAYELFAQMHTVPALPARIDLYA